MKKQISRKLWTIVCALLAFVLVFSLSACGGKNNGGGNGLTLSTKSVSVDVGASSVVIVTAGVSGSEEVTWSSSNDAVATVTGSGSGNKMGNVNGVSAGSATITATVGSKTAKCNVTVTDAEVITITQNGSNAPASIDLTGKTATVQLAATSTKNHDIVWESSKPLIVSVENGLVTALENSGTATITAKCSTHSDVKDTVQIVVGSGEDSYYEMTVGTAGTAAYAKENNVWCAWTEWGAIGTAEYDNGVARLDFSNNTWEKDGGQFYCVQLFYASDKNSFTEGTTYKLTFKLKATELKDVEGNDTDGGRVTVNGMQLNIAKSATPVEYEIYYNHNNTLCDFNMQFGQSGQFPTDILAGAFEFSDFKWEEAGDPVKLSAPSFTYNATTKVISITDSNPAQSCTYRLDLYNGAQLVGSVPVTNGGVVATSSITQNGEFDAYLVAIHNNPHYTDSDKSTSTAKVTVNNQSVTIAAGDQTAAINNPGNWRYFAMGGAVVDPVPFIDASGVIHIAYTNNNGNGGYGMQMFLENSGAVTGNNYKITCTIKSLGASGSVTVNGNAFTFSAANETKQVDVTFTEAGGDGTEASGYTGASAAIVFGTGDGSYEISDFAITAA